MVHVTIGLIFPCRSPTLTRYWDRPTDQFFQGSENTLEYERRKAVRVAFLPSPQACTLVLTAAPVV